MAEKQDSDGKKKGKKKKRERGETGAKHGGPTGRKKPGEV